MWFRTYRSKYEINNGFDRRSLGGAQIDFARQLAERNQAARPQKKFKTSAPKGVKLGSEYTDRAKERVDDVSDDRGQRIKALEESLKKEEIDQATFDRLRSEIAGGDLESTHLVKGLDFKLLQRIRRGEDVTVAGGEASTGPDSEAKSDNDDDEFDQLELKQVKAIVKDGEEEQKKKKGQLSTVTLAPGQKRSRDQILAELKASREAAAKAKQESTLGNRFRKINVQNKPGSRIERDSKGREVLIIVDEDGHEKRKVRKLQPGEGGPEPTNDELLQVDKSAKPLGMEVPEQYRMNKEEPEDDLDGDIFSDVGDDYDPLAGLDADSDSDEDATDGDGKAKSQRDGDEEPGEIAEEASDKSSMPPPSKPAVAAPRNYFKDSKTGLVSEEASKAPSMSDPAIMAAIKRAAALNPIGQEQGDGDGDGDGEDEQERRAREERRKKMLSTVDRDDEDMDMGFGTSRYEDEEDFDDSRVKLSAWGDEDGDEGGKGGGKGKRKRGPKKRKGDANNAADVLRVMEQRKRSEG